MKTSIEPHRHSAAQMTGVKPRSSIGWFVVVLAACGAPVVPAAPRPPVAAPAPVTVALLERRVPDALFAQGIALSRQGVSLRVEQQGARWQISLVDFYTGEIVATTRRVLPADRDAAIAFATERVVRLLAQVKGEAPPEGDSPDPAVAVAVAAEPAVTEPAVAAPARGEAGEAGEARFRREAIYFDTEPVVASEGNTVTQPRWKVYQGDPTQEMSARSFYRAIERPELYTLYARHRTATFVAYAFSGAMLVSGALFRSWGHDGNRDVGTGLLIGGGAVGAVSIGLAATQHPLGLADARALADAYNRRLRKQLGLSGDAAPPVVRAVRVSPYASTTGAALGGQF